MAANGFSFAAGKQLAATGLRNGGMTPTQLERAGSAVKFHIVKTESQRTRTGTRQRWLRNRVSIVQRGRMMPFIRDVPNTSA